MSELQRHYNRNRLHMGLGGRSTSPMIALNNVVIYESSSQTSKHIKEPKSGPTIAPRPFALLFVAARN